MDYEVTVIRQLWLTENVFEMRFRRPNGFRFIPGQKISLLKDGFSREYTLINAQESSDLSLCVRFVPEGHLTPLLAGAKAGDVFTMSSAAGFFTFQSRGRTAVFVATGTGIAPFLAFARAGIQGELLLHGATNERELLYRDEVEKAAANYIPCLTDPSSGLQDWSGRVTAYLESQIKVKEYDFYLCGNANMVRDAVKIIDSRFPGSRIFMETFY